MVKNVPANAGYIRDAGLTPGSGRAPGEGKGHSLQYSCLEISMDRRAWGRRDHPWGRKELATTEHIHFCPLSSPSLHEIEEKNRSV